ncbi:MAG: hypothetical protein H0Z32_00910 [Bacillaceae bacterium]|nr:hypothetical protein [Bacillaceae bacterium]
MSTALKKSYLVEKKGKLTRYEFEKELSHLYHRMDDVENKLSQKADDVVITMALNHRRELDHLQKEIDRLQNEIEHIKIEREKESNKPENEKSSFWKRLFKKSK